MARGAFPRGGVRARLPVMLRRLAVDEFDPTDISGLALWLDASDGATLFQNSDGTVPATASSDPVGYWGDKSGNGRHATQATGALRPTLGTLGAKNALAFAGNAIATQSYAAKATSTYVYVGSHDDSTDAFFQTGPTNGFHSHLVESTSKFRRNEAGTKGVVLASNVGVGAVSLWCVDFSNDAISVRHNGVTYGTTSVASETTISDSSRATTLGRLAAAETYAQLNGRIAEFMVYGGRNLTASERGRLERYLSAKYGITLAPQVSNADAQDWINRVYANGGTVTSSTAAAVNTLCDDINAAGIRDRFYRMGIFAGTGLNAALVPLYRGPSLGGTQYGNVTDTNVGPFVSGDYAETGPSGGLTGNGTSKYLDTGLTTGTIGLSNGHLSVYHSQPSGANQTRTWIGARDTNSASSAYLSNGLFSTSAVFGAFSGTSTANFNTGGSQTGAAAGHRLLSRTTATAMNNYYNAVSQASSATDITGSVSGLSSTRSLFVAAYNDQGTASQYMNGRIMAYSAGLGLSQLQAEAFYTAMQTFQTALTRNV